MLGVILWSSAPRKEAVVWCEDHGALAYVTGPHACVVQGAWPKQGQVVDVTTQANDSVRRIVAMNVLGGEVRLADKLLGHDGYAEAIDELDPLPAAG